MSEQKVKQTVTIVTVVLLVIFSGAFTLLNQDLIKDIWGGKRLKPLEIVYGFTPENHKLDSLANAGFDGVISLLHPDNQPFEPKVNEMIKNQALAAGLSFYNFPLHTKIVYTKNIFSEQVLKNRDPEDPRFIPDDLRYDRRSTDSLLSWSRTMEGRYYLCSHYDTERLAIALKILHSQRFNVRSHPDGVDPLPQPLNLPGRFARGEIVELDSLVYLVPMPTPEELYKHILTKAYGSAVEFPEIGKFVDHRSSFSEPWLDFHFMLNMYQQSLGGSMIDTFNYDAERVLKHVESAKNWSKNKHASLPFLLFVQHYPSVVGQSVVQAWRGDVPPLPPLLFKQPMKNGRVKIVKPNIAVGPRPTEDEFDDYLARRGIRHIVYIGELSLGIQDEDAGMAAAAGMEWSEQELLVLSLLNQLREGGPYYIYGSGSINVEEEIFRRWGPAIPDSTTGVPEPVEMG